MKRASFFYYLAFLLILVACTGQNPAPLKNPSSSRAPIKAACSNLKFEGQVLSKKNIQNIFDCSGWAKVYPDFYEKIRNTEESKIDNAFEVFNRNLFFTNDQRKKLYSLTSHAQEDGQIDSLSNFVEKSLKDYALISQINLVLNSDKVSAEERTSFMKFLSGDNKNNLRYVKSFVAFAASFEKHKASMMKALEVEDEVVFRKRLVTLLDDLAGTSRKDWKHIQGIISSNDKSVIKDWASEGKTEDVSNLLGVIKGPSFLKDVKFLNEKLETGLTCKNSANVKDFEINLKQELKHKIDSLKNDSYERFEEVLFHGFQKFVAFHDFCQEEKYQQGLSAFSNVLDYCFKIIPVPHDYKFLKGLHQTFGEDRFAILRFLSTKTFSELRDLFIHLDGQDQEVVRVLFEIISDIPDKDLDVFSEFPQSVAENNGQFSAWFQSWSKIWMGLSENEKLDFINLLSSLADPEINSSHLVDIVLDLFESYPSLSEDLSKALGTTSYQSNIQYLLTELSDEKIQKDLSHFLSDKGLFEFIRILTYSSVNRTETPLKQEAPSGTNTYVLRTSSTQKSQIRECYEVLNDQYKKEPSYYSLVNGLPETCLQVMGRVGFVGHIYVWMNTANKFFEETYHVDDFHSKDGMWAPSMLHTIFTAAIKADGAILSTNGSKGIKNNLVDIHQTLTAPNFLEAFHLFGEVYLKTVEVVPFESKIQKFLAKSSSKSINKWTNGGFDLLKKHENIYQVKANETKCSDLNPDLGVSVCLSDKEITDQVIEILRLAKRRFDNNPTLMEELIKWLHPGAGISLPFRKEQTKVYSISMEELVKFLYDLSSERTVKEFTYMYPDRTIQTKGTAIDRLEVVIRDISFNNNFYGAFFKNEVAGYRNYRSEMISSEKLLKWMNRLSGPLRNMGMDHESKWKLKNVRGTFSSLIEVSDEYPQKDGNVKTYNDFIQSLLAAIANSSKTETQDFSAYRPPRGYKAEGHNGVFLTKIVETSGLRHLARFVRSRFGDLESLNSAEFKKVNKNLFARHDVKTLQNGVQGLFDRYLDNDRNQMNLLISDVVSFISSLSKEEQAIAEEIALKLVLLLSEEKVSTEKIQKVAEGLELFIKKWPEVRQVLLKIENKKEALNLINKMMDSLVAEPAAVENLLEMFISGEFISLKDLENLLNNENLRSALGVFLNHLSSMDPIKSEINWVDTLRAILGDADFRFDPILKWLEISMDQKLKNKLSVSILIEVLSEKSGQNYRLKSILDEFFINHPEDLNQFLNETFPAMKIKN